MLVFSSLRPFISSFLSYSQFSSLLRWLWCSEQLEKFSFFMGALSFSTGFYYYLVWLETGSDCFPLMLWGHFRRYKGCLAYLQIKTISSSSYSRAYREFIAWKTPWHLVSFSFLLLLLDLIWDWLPTFSLSRMLEFIFWNLERIIFNWTLLAASLLLDGLNMSI